MSDTPEKLEWRDLYRQADGSLAVDADGPVDQESLIALRAECARLGFRGPAVLQKAMKELPHE